MRISQLAAVAIAAMTVPSVGDDVNFNRDVKPILSDNCFTCHGPDEKKRESGLRLDQREGAIRPAESGETAIVPGDPDRSELLKRISCADTDLRMPPADTGKRLTDAEIQTLRSWITSGAEYRGHWAFESPIRSPLPSDVSDTNPIDRFIRSRLKQEGLSASPEAGRETLIRRVSLDLTGLPPTPDEIDRFLADQSEAAYEVVVDRLLASPRYGERMAISWLDYARYADSNGFQSDGSRDIWAWRDWVIRAYNRNLPFDQFTVEQLAGDLLPDPTREQIIATGFNRNHRLNGEGGRIEAEWFVETVIDRVETTGLTWLGLTFNCCRCHDHKFDPISQRDFYQLFAFFNSVEESGVLAPAGKNGENTPPLLTLTTPETDATLLALDAAVDAAKSRVAEAEAGLPAMMAEWESTAISQLAGKSTWGQVEPTKVTSSGGAMLVRQEDGSFLATGVNPPNDSYRITIPLNGKHFSGLLLEAFPDASLPNQSLGRGFNGNFVLTDVTAEITSPSLKKPIAVKFAKVAADYEQPGYTASTIRTVKPRPNGKQKAAKGWAIDGNDPAKRIARRLMLVADKRIELPTGAALEILIQHASNFADHNVGRFRIQISDADPSVLDIDGSGIPADLLAILETPSDLRTAQQSKRLQDHFRTAVPNPALDAEAAVKVAEQKVTEFRNSLPTTMVMKEAAPRDAFLLTRGEYDRPAEKVSRGLPAFLPPLPEGATADRLGLARWIVDERNPLTARVWVNREWERFFGTGLVKTTENLGTQAEFPSHPELLDWLAVEFMRPEFAPSVSGVPAQAWDMKALQKLILMSATYRQSSAVAPESLHRDPDNRLLSRGSRFRLTGELIRDQALAVSGLMVDQIGGPSVRPYMPEGVWDETSKYGDLRGYKNDHGEGLYRRTMYTIWKRTAAPPTLLLFDAPNREVCTIKRSRTNTPLQALALLNEVTFVEAARSLATRILREGGSAVDERMRYGFRIVAGRFPTDGELRILVAGLKDDHRTFTENADSARQLTEVGELAVPEDLNPAELAAWTVTANVLLNLDEFVTRD